MYVIYVLHYEGGGLRTTYRVDSLFLLVSSLEIKLRLSGVVSSPFTQ